MISVVIPAYKNTKELVANLSKNLKYLKDCEVIIVNDDPSTSIKNDLKQFTGLKIIENSKNLGFGGAVNTGVWSATNDYVILLNSDVILHDDSYKAALKRLKNDSSLFAVSFAQSEADGTVVGKNKIYFHQGLVSHTQATDLKLGPTGWAEGGSCMINRQIFMTLGGFDLLYTPFYWEDIDLSYNAWKSGYQVLFDPAILVEHHHGSTTNKYFQPYKIKSTSYRNQLIFTWKNIDDAQYCLQEMFYLPYIKLKMLRTKELAFFDGFFQALLHIPHIIKSHVKVKKIWRIHDKEIFDKFT